MWVVVVCLFFVVVFFGFFGGNQLKVGHLYFSVTLRHIFIYTHCMDWVAVKTESCQIGPKRKPHHAGENGTSKIHS